MKQIRNFLPALMMGSFLLSGCSNTQPTRQITMTDNKKITIESESKKYRLTQDEYYDSFMKRYIEGGYTEDEYFNYVVNPDYNKRYDDPKKLGLTEYEYFGSVSGRPTDMRIRGAYYCGDGGCDPLMIDILVYKNEVENTTKEIKKLNNFISSVQMSEKESCYAYNDVKSYQYQLQDKYNRDPWNKSIGIKENIDLENTVCLTAKSYPNLEPQATFALRKLNTVLYAIRTGGEAGADVAPFPAEDFETKGESYLEKQNQLDNVKLTMNQEDSLKSNYVNKE